MKRLFYEYIPEMRLESLADFLKNHRIKHEFTMVDGCEKNLDIPTDLGTLRICGGLARLGKITIISRGFELSSKEGIVNGKASVSISFFQYDDERRYPYSIAKMKMEMYEEKED